MLTTFLVVPAWSDQAGQLRIVSREHDNKFRLSLTDYRRAPDLWKDVGLVSSSGVLRCIEAHADVARYIRESEPIYPPSTFTFDANSVPA